MHHDSHPPGAPPNQPFDTVLYQAVDGHPVTHINWLTHRQHAVIRQIEFLAGLLVEEIPTTRSPELEQAVDHALASKTMDQMIRLLQQLPSEIHPAPMSRAEILVFALRLYGRVLQSVLSRGNG